MTKLSRQFFLHTSAEGELRHVVILRSLADSMNALAEMIGEPFAPWNRRNALGFGYEELLQQSSGALRMAEHNVLRHAELLEQRTQVMNQRRAADMFLETQARFSNAAFPEEIRAALCRSLTQRRLDDVARCFAAGMPSGLFGDAGIPPPITAQGLVQRLGDPRFSAALGRLNLAESRIAAATALRGALNTSEDPSGCHPPSRGPGAGQPAPAVAAVRAIPRRVSTRARASRIVIVPSDLGIGMPTAASVEAVPQSTVSVGQVGASMVGAAGVRVVLGSNPVAAPFAVLAH